MLSKVASRTRLPYRCILTNDYESSAREIIKKCGKICFYRFVVVSLQSNVGNACHVKRLHSNIINGSEISEQSANFIQLSYESI